MCMVGNVRQFLNPLEIEKHRRKFADNRRTAFGQCVVWNAIQEYQIVEGYDCSRRQCSSLGGNGLCEF